MEIIEFYAETMKSLGATVTDAGDIVSPGGKTFDVEGKTLVLPTRDRLKANEWSTTQPFHPMCEDAVMGQSPVMHWLARTVKIALSMHLGSIMTIVLETAAKPELQEQAKDPKLVDILGSCKTAKASTLVAWNKIIAKMNTKEIDLLHIALNRGGNIDGEKYHRVCNVHFPILDDKDDDGFLYGIKMSKNDKLAIVGLFNYIITGVTWNFGSNDTVPYFHSLMSMYASFVKRYNFFAKVLKRISDFKPLATDWILELNDLRQFMNKIPKLSGNEGKITRAAKKKDIESVGVKPSSSLYDTIKVPVPAPVDDDKAPWDETPKEVTPSITKPGTAGAIKLGDIITNRKPTMEEVLSGNRTSDRLLGRDRRDDRDIRNDRYDRFGRDDRGGRSDRDSRDDRNVRRDRDEPRGGGTLRLSDLGVGRRY